MAEGLTVRLMQPGDGAAWQQVFAAVADDGLWIGAEPPVRDRSAEVEAQYVGSASDVMFLACVETAVVGWISGDTDETGCVELGMGVLDAFRGQGIGSALMEVIVGWAGAQPLTLRVFPHNERALALYRKFGFVEVPEKVGVWPRRNGEFWDLLFMQRPVRPI